jgi:hypothetical protein
MKSQVASTVAPDRLLQMATGIVVQQALYAAARLGIADLVDGCPRTLSDLAAKLGVKDSMLWRVMRLLASQGVFEEVVPGVFGNSDLSCFLRTGISGSVRSIVIFRGSDFCFAPFGEILHSIETGEPAREKLYGKNAFDHMKEDPETARIFDDAMTNMSQLIAPAVAEGYDFGAWGSVIDVGGGNGALLAAILKAHPGVHGVLADLPQVLDRARERGFLGGELEARCELQPCDFFREVPSGCRACVMKSIIHDWDDPRAHQILVNCRRAMPDDGVLLLVELILLEGDAPCLAKLADISMMVLTGGRERNVQEYRELLAGAGFHHNRIIPVSGEFSIVEATPKDELKL